MGEEELLFGFTHRRKNSAEAPALNSFLAKEGLLRSRGDFRHFPLSLSRYLGPFRGKALTVHLMGQIIDHSRGSHHSTKRVPVGEGQEMEPTSETRGDSRL